MFIVARLSALAKNVPQRNRAGFKFTHLPQVADVTDEQLAIIKADQYLKICNFPSVAWFEAMSIERTQKNEDKLKDKNGEYVPVKTVPKTARMAPLVGLEGVVEPNRTIVDPGASGDLAGASKDGTKDGHTPTAQAGVSNQSGQKQPASATPGAPDGLVVGPKGKTSKPMELSASSSKEDLIAALTAKRQEPGKDFNPDASPEALFALLRKL